MLVAQLNADLKPQNVHHVKGSRVQKDLPVADEQQTCRFGPSFLGLFLEHKKGSPKEETHTTAHGRLRAAGSCLSAFPQRGWAPGQFLVKAILGCLL